MSVRYLFYFDTWHPPMAPSGGHSGITPLRSSLGRTVKIDAFCNRSSYQLVIVIFLSFLSVFFTPLR